MDNNFKNVKHSLTKKITLGFIIVISIVGVFAFSLYNYYNNKFAKQDQIYWASNCARTAANILYDAPISDFLKSGKDIIYKEYLSNLSAICKNFDLKYLYVYIPDFKKNKLKTIFYLDGKSENNIPKRDLGTVVSWDFNSAEKNAFFGIQDSKIIETNNQFGHVMTRYAAVYDSNNKPIALVGVDLSFDEINFQLMINFVRGFLVIFVCLFLIYILLVLYIKQIILKPVSLISSRMFNFIKDNEPGQEPIILDTQDELASMADAFNRMVADINSYTQQIYDTQMETIFSLAKLAQSRDDDTGKHLERVKQYCYVITQKLAEDSPYSDLIDDEFIKNIVNASSLHDIGKVGISDLILLKNGKLTDEEFAQIKKHTIIGAQTLSEVHSKFGNNSFIEMGMIIANYHHERWDGRGYPEGLKGKDIPLAARIMSVADVYDALGTKRVYKDAFSQEKCIAIIKEERGTQFDPIIVDAFLDVVDKLYRVRQEMED